MPAPQLMPTNSYLELARDRVSGAIECLRVCKHNDDAPGDLVKIEESLRHSRRLLYQAMQHED